MEPRNKRTAQQDQTEAPTIEQQDWDELGTKVRPDSAAGKGADDAEETEGTSYLPMCRELRARMRQAIWRERLGHMPPEIVRMSEHLTQDSSVPPGGLLSWSSVRLASKVGMSEGVVRLFDSGGHISGASKVASIRRALKTEGVVFTADGVRLRRVLPVTQSLLWMAKPA